MPSFTLLGFVVLVLCMSIGFVCYLIRLALILHSRLLDSQGELKNLRQRLVERGMGSWIHHAWGKETFILTLPPKRVFVRHRRLQPKENP